MDLDIEARYDAAQRAASAAWTKAANAPDETKAELVAEAEEADQKVSELYQQLQESGSAD